MKRWIFGIVFIIIAVYVILNKGGGASLFEGLAGEARTRSTISDINIGLDIIGDKKFYNVEIDTPGFKGEVEQPASYFKSALTTYRITDTVSLKYDNEKITLDGATGTLKDSSLPKDVKATGSEIEAQSLLARGTGGIRPILKDETTSSEWVNDFLFTSAGLDLRALSQYDSVWNSLNDFEKQVQFLEWMFGKPQTAGEAEWDSYKVDRIAGLREINVDALTGVEKSKRTLALIDPNRVTLYEVVHVNTSTYKNVNRSATPFPGAPSDTDGALSAFTNDVAHHVNQVIGGKVLLIPHRDTFIVKVDNETTFKLD